MKWYLLFLSVWTIAGCQSDSFHRGYVISQTDEPLGEAEIEPLESLEQ